MRIRVRPQTRARALAALLAFVVSCLFLVLQLLDAEGVNQRVWWQPEVGEQPGLIESMARTGDGYIPVMLAQDPLIRRPHEFGQRGDGPVYRGMDLQPIWRDLAAYRWQRPAGVYLVWATSLGRQHVAPYVLLILALFGPSFAAWWGAALLQQGGVPGWLGGAVALLPGAYASMQFLGLEMLALGVVLWGLARDDLRGLSLGGLFRETLLIPSLILLARTRRAKYLVPALAFVGWAILIRLRIGGWFFEADTGRLGFIEAAWPFLFLTVSFLVRKSRWAPYIWAYAIMSLFLGWEVYWGRHFTRPMLPWFVFVWFAATERFYDLRRAERVPAPEPLPPG